MLFQGCPTTEEPGAGEQQLMFSFLPLSRHTSKKGSKPVHIHIHYFDLLFLFLGRWSLWVERNYGDPNAPVVRHSTAPTTPPLASPIQNTVVQWKELQGKRCGSHKRHVNMQGLLICKSPQMEACEYVWGTLSTRITAPASRRAPCRQVIIFHSKLYFLMCWISLPSVCSISSPLVWTWSKSSWSRRCRRPRLSRTLA